MRNRIEMASGAAALALVGVGFALLQLAVTIARRFRRHGGVQPVVDIHSAGSWPSAKPSGR